MKKYIILLLGGFLILKSCTLVTEPERFFNDKAYPPDLYYFNFENLQLGQHVDGTMIIYFNPPNIDYEYDAVGVYIDSVRENSFYILPCTLQLDTRRYSEGLHSISFGVFRKDKPHGLLNMFGVASTIFETQLYFDRTAPDKVLLTVTKETEDEIILNWSESTSQNFFSYLIYKSVENGEFKVIDTISNKGQTNYIDREGVGLIGAKYSYKVAVTTDYKSTFQTLSDNADIKIGNALAYQFTRFKGGPYLNDENQKVFFIVDRKIVVFNTTNDSLIAEIDISNMITQDEYIDFQFNNDKSKIYLLKYEQKQLWVLNSETFQVLKEVTLVDCYTWYYILDDNRIMFNYGSELKIVNINTNQIENEVNIFDSVYVNSAILSSDNTKLILNWRRNLPNIPTYFYIAEMDATNSEFNILRMKEFNNYLRIERSGDMVCADGVDFYDLSSLEWSASIPFQKYVLLYSTIEDKVSRVTDNKYLIPNLYEINCYYVDSYNLQNQKIKDWYISYWARDIQLGHNKVYIGLGKENILGHSLKYGE